jgi:hypothetical protein
MESNVHGEIATTQIPVQVVGSGLYPDPETDYRDSPDMAALL